MIARATGALVLLSATIAIADTARIQVSDELAAAIVEGDHGGLVVSVNRSSEGSVALVTQRIEALVEGGLPVMSSRDECPDPEALDAADLGVLPPELRRAAQTRSSDYQLVVEVVAWVSERIVQDERDRAAQDAASVLARRRGRCSGRANLAVGLLRVLGVPARVVHGVLAADDAVRPHRWGEAWLGTAGWVAFDPGSAAGLVRVRYLPTVTTLDENDLRGARLAAAEEPGFAALPRWRGLRVRPERGATLRCVSAEGRLLTARLEGPDGIPRELTGIAFVRFAGLIPGGYTLSWSRDGRENGPIRFTLSAEQDVQLSLDTLEGSGR